MTRRFWIPLVLAIAATAGGCSCDNDNEPQQSVSITSPKSAATLTLDDDVDNTAAGLQFEVKVSTAHFATDGSTAAKLFVDGKEHAQATIGSDGTATLVVDTSALAIPDGSHILSVTATDAAGSAQSAKVAVVVDLTEIPCTVRITTPADNAILNAKSDVDASRAGVQTDVVVHTAGCSGGKVRVCLKGEGLTGTACKGNEGIAVAEADLSPTNTTTLRTDWVEGPVDVYAEHDSTTVTEAEPVNVTVDSLAPTCSFPSLVDGETLNSQNVYVVVQTSNAEVGQPVVLTSSLKPEAMSGTVTATGEANVAAILPLGEQVLTAHVSDQSGNDGSCSITVTVDVDGCDATFTDPSTSQYVFNASNAPDGKYTVRGHTSRCPEGKAHFSKTVGGVVTELGTADADTNGDFSKELTFADGETDATLTVHVEKEGYTSNAGTFFNYTADYSAPTCTFVSPTDGAIVTTQTPTVQLQVEGAGTGQTVTLSTSGKPETMTGTTTAGGEVSIAASLPLGEQTLTATFKDKAGNEGSCSISVTVNVEGCDVVLEDPATPELIVNIANGNPSGDPLQGTYTIKGSTTRCAGGTLTFTKTIGAVAGTPEMATVDSDGNFSFAVTFADGESDATLNVRIDGTNTAPNAGVDIAYFSDFTAPQVVQAVPEMGNLYIVNAANSHLVAGEAGYVEDEDPATAGGQVSANLTLSGIGSVATAGFGSALTGSATLAMGTTTETLLETSGNGEQTASAALDLAEGYAGTLVLTLTDSAGNSTTAQWNAKVSTVALPTPTIDSPSGTVNIVSAKSTDRLTQATVESYVRLSSTAPAGCTIRLCSNLPGGSGGCSTSGFSPIDGTIVAVSGSYHLYPEISFPQAEFDLIAELTDPIGTSTTTSAAKHLIVDTIPPSVATVVLADDANSDGILNGTEWALARATKINVTFNGVEDGQVATLSDTASSFLTTAQVTSHAATFSISSLDDKTYTFQIAVSDKAGNKNFSTLVSPPITDPNASLTVTVKRLPPSISKVAPSFNVCNQQNDADALTPNTCELDFVVAIKPAEAARLDFTLEPSTAGTITPATVTSFSSTQVTARYSLNQSASAVVLRATLTDKAGNTWSTPYTISLVDTIPPTLSILTPGSGSTVFSQTIPFSAETDAEPGRQVIVQSMLNSTQVGAITVVAGSPLNTTTAGATVTLPYGDQTLRAQVTDQAGNTSSPAFTSIYMTLNGCDLSFVSPSTSTPVFNATNTAAGKVTIQGYSSRSGCQNRPLIFKVAVNGGAETTVGTGSEQTDGSGNFSFDYTFTDGTITVFSATVDVSGSTPTTFTATTDLTPPSLLSITAPSPNSAKQLFVVASAGNIRLASTAGYVADADSNLDDGQVQFSAQIAGGGVAVGSGSGWFDVRQGSGDCLDVPMSSECKIHQAIADNGTVDLGPLLATLTATAAAPLTITVTDSAGNQISDTWTATVDVVAPTTPALVTTYSSDGKYTHVTDYRHADISVYITAPSDPDTLDWDFGYTNDLILGTTPLDDTAFDTIATKAAPTPAGPGLMSVALTNLAPLNNYRLMPRVIDPVGNRSALSATALSTQWSSSSLTYPGSLSSGASFGNAVQVGDFNKDGYSDVVVQALESNDTGSLTVYYGQATFPLTDSQRWTGSGNYAYFGNPFAVGDISGDGASDLVAYDTDHLNVYLAPTGGGRLPSTPSFTITGDYNIFTAAIVADLNKDGLNDLAMGNPTGTGKLYVLFGRPDWSSVISAGSVSLSAAEVLISGSVSGSYFGGGKGPASIPDIDGDGYNELLVPAEFAGKGYLFKGSTLATTRRATTINDAVQTLGAAGTTDFVYSCASLDMNADGMFDLLLGSRDTAGKTFSYSRTGTSFSTSPSLFFSGSGAMGATLAVGDLSNDGKADLLISGRATTTQAVNVFWSSSTALSATPGSVLAGGPGFGGDIAIGDINKDGNLDLVIGASTNGNGTVTLLY